MAKLLIQALTCALILTYCLSRDFGFMLFLVIPIVFVLLLVEINGIKKSPQNKSRAIIRIGMCAFNIIVVILAHIYYATSARRVADRVAVAVVAYHKENGFYPVSIAHLPAHLPADLQREAKYWRLYYSLDDRGPGLHYPVTGVIFEHWLYNFEEGAWEYLPD